MVMMNISGNDYRLISAKSLHSGVRFSDCKDLTGDRLQLSPEGQLGFEVLIFLIPALQIF